jgi:hypothetical protein
MDSPRLTPPDYLSLREAGVQSAFGGATRQTPTADRDGGRQPRGSLRLVPALSPRRRPVVTRSPGVVKPTDRDRRLIAVAVRHGKLAPSQAWRWEWSASPLPKPAWNRLAALAASGWLLKLELLRGEGIYVPTPAGARLVADLTGALAAPRAPTEHAYRWLAQLPHDLTIAEVERWLLGRAGAGARFLTERELARDWARARPAGQRRGARGMPHRPDGVVVMPDGQRVAVEVELHAKAAERLAEKLAWYRHAASRGDYAEVLWLVPGKPVERALSLAIVAAGCGELMAVETLPPDCLVYAG